MAEDAPKDCTRCGACCFSESPRHARVTGDDYARLGDDAAHLVVFLENQAFMRIEHAGEASPIGRCAALVLHDGAAEFSCSVYARRPEVCRALERGSSGCDGERDAKAERPKRALAVLRVVRITPPA